MLGRWRGALAAGIAIALYTLLLAEDGFAPLNRPDWIENRHPQLILLSVGTEGKRSLPSPETLEAVQGYTLLRTEW